MINKNQYVEIVENYVAAYNSSDIDSMLSNMHKDVKFEDISDGKVNLHTDGIDELKTQAEQAKHFFSDRKQTIRDLKIGNDLIELDVDYRAVLAIDFPNGLKAGDTVTLEGKSIFKFKDDKIIELKDIS